MTIKEPSEKSEVQLIAEQAQLALMEMLREKLDAMIVRMNEQHDLWYGMMEIRDWNDVSGGPVRPKLSGSNSR